MFVNTPVGCSVLQPVPAILRLGGTSLTYLLSTNCVYFSSTRSWRCPDLLLLTCTGLMQCSNMRWSLQYEEGMRMDKHGLSDVLGGSTELRLAECSFPCSQLRLNSPQVTSA